MYLDESENMVDRRELPETERLAGIEYKLDPESEYKANRRVQPTPKRK